MPANPDRRAAIAAAALAVLGRDGMRGLTHRAVDREAGLPMGTTSNYLPNRRALVEAAAAACLERLRVAPRDRARLRVAPPGLDTLAAYLAAYVRQCTDDREALLAWFELRLQAAREPDLTVVADALRRRHDANLVFALERGLPGTDEQHRRLLHALDGILLAAASGAASPEEAVADTDVLVRAVVGSPPAGLRGWLPGRR